MTFKGYFKACFKGYFTSTFIKLTLENMVLDLNQWAQKIAGVSRGNTIRGKTTRNSERKMALWEGLWEGLWKTSENL